MELFRGYVPTRNKQCLEKFKGVEKLKTRSEVQNLDEYAGILGEETILIDVDDAETSELLFRSTKTVLLVKSFHLYLVYRVDISSVTSVPAVHFPKRADPYFFNRQFKML